MTRKIKIDVGPVSAVAVLLDEQAPITCNAIWKALPVKGSLMHAIVEGREAFLPLLERLNIPPENQTIYPITGDLVYYHKPINHVYLDIPLVDRDVEVISIIYGRDTQIYGPVLPLAVNHFAVIESGLDELASEISRMRKCGFGSVHISRVEL